MKRISNLFLLFFILLFAAGSSFAGNSKINGAFRRARNISVNTGGSSADSVKGAKAVSKGARSSTETARGSGTMPSLRDKTHIKYYKKPVATYKSKKSPAAVLAGASASDSSYRISSSYLSDIRDQGSDNDCWAFASFASLEANLHKAGDYDNGQKHDFWEYHMASSHGFDFEVDDGGTSDMAAAYLARWDGPVKENAINPAAVKHVQGVYDLPAPDESYYGDSYAENGGANRDSNFITGIKEALIEYGPVYISISAQDRFWNNYYKDFYAYDCTAPYGKGGSCDIAENSYTGHAVSIIGWDDSYSQSNFGHAPPGDGAFIVRNSWGADVGEGGYFYLSYYDSSISDPVVFETPESTGNYKTQYSYDSLGNVIQSGCLDFEYCTDTASAWAANIFTAENDGKVKAVSFFTTNSDVNCHVYVYTDVSSNMPRSGTEYDVFNGAISHSGYHTIKVPDDLNPLIKKGKRFSVVIKFSDQHGYENPLATEYRYPGYSSNADAGSGQSFYSLDGTKNSVWKDISTINRARTYDDAVYDIQSGEYICDVNFGTPVLVGSERRCYYDYSTSNFPIKAFVNDDATAPYWPDNTEVRDGPDTGADISITDNDTELSANWDSAADDESGISGYMVAISTDKGSSYITDWTDVGDVSAYTQTGLELVFNETYYFGVKAYNAFGTLSEAKWSSGQRLWYKRPAKVPFVNDGYYENDSSGEKDDDYIRNTGSLSAHWGASVISDPDSHSAAEYYKYAIGTSAGGTDISNRWLTVDSSEAASLHVTISTDSSGSALVLENGKTYYYSVIAVDANGKKSETVISNGQTIDETAPKINYVDMPEKVTFGTFYGTFTMNKPYASIDGLPEMWFEDSEKNRGEIAVSNVSSLIWEFSGIVNKGEHALGTATLYFKAKSKSGIEGTGIDSGSSFVIAESISDDQSPPVWPSPAVRDGLTNEDLESTPSNTSLSANWNAAVDYESGILRYEYRIGTVMHAADIVPGNDSWASAGTDTFVTAENLELEYGTTYYFTIRAVNGAGLSSREISSNGQWVDESKPGNISAVYCSWENSVPEYANWSSSFTARWSASDRSVGEERAAIGYRYAIGTENDRTSVTNGWITKEGTVTQVKAEGISLADGADYYFTVKAYNQYDRESAPNYCRISIDMTAPQISELTLGSLPQKTGSGIYGVFKLTENSDRLESVPQLSFKNSEGDEYPLSVTAHNEGTGFLWDFSGFVDSSEGMEGSASFVLSVYDKAGNFGDEILASKDFSISALKNNETSSVTFRNSDGCRAEVPEGTFSGSVKLTITEADSSKAQSADSNSLDSTALRTVYLPREFKAYDSSGSVIQSFPKSIKIVFPYPDSDGDGKTDGDYLDVDTLFVHHLNESDMTWVPLANTVRDAALKEISAEVNHFSIYSVRSVSRSSLSFDVVPAPNPCYFTRNVLTLLHIPVDASGVKAYIYNSAGELVRELPQETCGAAPCVIWDGKTKNGSMAASGVYIYLVSTDNRGKASGKFYAIW